MEQRTGSPPAAPTAQRRQWRSLAALPTGSILLGLDAVCLALLWPLVLWRAWPVMPAPLTLPLDLRCVLYPVADLVMMYAMGLYRREALVHPSRSLHRVSLAVGMAAIAAGLAAAVLPSIVPAAFARPDGRDQMVGFALATLCCGCCALCSRLLLTVLQRHRLLHRRLLVVGAGQRAWDLLHMLTKEGGSLNYRIAFLHHDALGGIDPRLAADPDARILHSGRFAVLRAARGWAPTRSSSRPMSGAAWTCRRCWPARPPASRWCNTSASWSRRSAAST